MTYRNFSISVFFSSLFLFIFPACAQIHSPNAEHKKEQLSDKKEAVTQVQKQAKHAYYSHTEQAPLRLSEEEWKKILDPDLYEVSRNKDTERPFTGKYWDYEGKGTYYCAACGNILFRSDAKFASSCGWPSFFEQKNPKSITFKEDKTHGMIRTETLCGRCGGHLGHIFDDGPAPTYKRYCMNSIALDFEPDELRNKVDTLVLGGGCFWCVEAVYEQLEGVQRVESGYSGGTEKDADYYTVSAGITDHVEVTRIVFDSDKTNLAEILSVFFVVHDPTTLNKQGADEGKQYRSVIFYRNEEQKKVAEAIIADLEKSKAYKNPIVTAVEPFQSFFKAEEYHQDYFKNNPEKSYCQMVIQPKMDKFEKVFKDKLKKK